MVDPQRLVQLGVFGAAQGLRGEVRVNSFTADPTAIGAYGPLTDATCQKQFIVKVVRSLKAALVVVRVDGVTTREAAESLTGLELFARRSQLSPARDGEYYYDDLIGLTAITAAGEVLGRVSAVLNFGAGDILEIAPSDAGDTLLLPFSDVVAPIIDLTVGHIVIERPTEVEVGPDEDVEFAAASNSVG
jgi:16S rRNA processing protein RimM